LSTKFTKALGEEKNFGNAKPFAKLLMSRISVTLLSEWVTNSNE